MKKRQIDKIKTKQVRIDTGMHYYLKIEAARQHTTLRDLIEGCLAELLAADRQEQ